VIDARSGVALTGQCNTPYFHSKRQHDVNGTLSQPVGACEAGKDASQQCLVDLRLGPRNSDGAYRNMCAKVVFVLWENFGGSVQRLLSVVASGPSPEGIEGSMQ
jgi:hypothetical protein